MRIVDVRADHEAEDVKSGRKVLQMEIDHPSKNVMVIRGRSAEVAHFADRAAARSDPFPWRVAVWVKDPEKILTENQKQTWFDGEVSACAAVLDFGDELIERLRADASLTAIEKAFLRAQVGGA